jgi:predicted phosphatase
MYQVPAQHFEIAIAFMAVIIISQLFQIILGMRKNYFLKRETELLEKIEKERQERIKNGSAVYRKRGRR